MLLLASHSLLLEKRGGGVAQAARQEAQREQPPPCHQNRGHRSASAKRSATRSCSGHPGNERVEGNPTTMCAAAAAPSSSSSSPSTATCCDGLVCPPKCKALAVYVHQPGHCPACNGQQQATAAQQATKPPSFDSVTSSILPAARPPAHRPGLEETPTLTPSHA